MAGFILPSGGTDMAAPYTKAPLTFEEQLDLLAGRGLIIADRPAAEIDLSRINYYRFSAYAIPFKKEHDKFRDGTTWEEVFALYEFDRKLRILVMDALERVEVAIRTAVAYQLAHAYGSFAHTDSNNFRFEFEHAEWLTRLNGDVKESKETFIEHYKIKYQAFPKLPIWMAAEVMTFGSLSRLFAGMKNREQDAICSSWKIPRLVMKSWLQTLTFVRNTCAHHARLWNRELAIAPMMPQPKHGWPTKDIPNQQRMFCVMIILRHLLDGQQATNPWQPSITELIKPFATNPHFRNNMGLTDDWETHSRWKL